MMKLEGFRVHHEKEKPPCQEECRITDFWELSWDKLLIKSEKLGSGAYGQVFRGTFYGKPPSFEHVYQIDLIR
uniref:Uncharacterized protein n=1 Tax=Ditylenchus dipsaci TaxID=166011 RepID=A0A915D7A7_9BILA